MGIGFAAKARTECGHYPINQLEQTTAEQSGQHRTRNLYPHRSSRDFRFLELSRTTWLVTSLSRERGRRCQSTLCQPMILATFLIDSIASGAGTGPEEAVTSTGRHSGGRARGVLDPSSADGERYREPRRRSGVDYRVSPAAASEDRQTRWRHTGSYLVRLQTR
jgi:hypothetical protein